MRAGKAKRGKHEWRNSRGTRSRHCSQRVATACKIPPRHHSSGVAHLMGKIVMLHSALAPLALADMIRRSIDQERRTLFSFSGYKGSLPVIGTVSDRTFRLQKRRFGRNDFSPQFHGEFQAEPGGSRIEGYFDISSWVKVFMRLWLGGVVLL